MFKELRQPAVLFTTLAAAGILLVTMGSRQSIGLFINPIMQSTGLNMTTLSFALAVGQLMWGVIQPVAGALSDRFGPQQVLIWGVLTLALGVGITPFMTSGFGLTVSLGLLMAMGSGAGSFSVLIGAAAQRLPLEARASASGVINAGGSAGQFVFAPLMQKCIQVLGWMGALWTMAGLTLLALPLIARLMGEKKAEPMVHKTEQGNFWQSLGEAMKNPSYLLLHFGFFTCGFHIAFLVTHLPTEVGLCGLPPSVASWSLALIGLSNIFGSLYAGYCVSRYRSKYVLAAMYGSRALLVIWYLMMPRTEWTFYIFAIGLGFTWLATVPPTAAIVSKLFGIRYLATLFGLTVFTHQIGGFLGAYLGGWAITRFGDYGWMWYADIALAALAAIANLPIREAKIAKQSVPVAA